MVGVCAIVVQSSVVGPVVKRFGERAAMTLGLGSGAVGFAVFALAPSGPLCWVGIPIMALWGIANPALQGLMTQRVPPDQQGRLQGAANSVQSIAQLLGPFPFTLTFAYFIGPHASMLVPGAPFFLAAALLAFAMLIAMRATRRI